MAVDTSAQQPAQESLAQIRQDVALANHIVHRMGLVTAFGHVTARVPGTNTFLIPTRASPALADPNRLIQLDFDGNRVQGEGTPNTEFWIHARIYAARPDVGAVAHVHAPNCVILGQLGQTVRPMHNSGAQFADGVPVFERVGLIRSRELGDQVAASLGSHRGMLLRGHGANVAGEDIQRVTVWACFLEEAAQLQVQSMAAVGGDASRIRFYTDEEGASARAEQDNNGPQLRAWQYYATLAQQQP